MATETLNKKMTGDEMIALSKKHTLFEWSAQSKVDPIPVERAKGIYFWTPEGKRFIDFNSQLMCVNIGHGDERVIKAIHDQASVLAYANPFMATEARARLGGHEGVRVRQHLRLLLNRADDALVAVADVHAHQLAVEVDEALPFRRPEVDALRACHRNRIDLGLRRPLEERVLLRKRNHLVAGHRFLQRFGRHLQPRFRLRVDPDRRFTTKATNTRRLYFLSIASRFALNSLPGFQSGNLSACATRWPTANRTRRSSRVPVRSQSGITTSSGV